MTTASVVIVSGPPGSGKTTVSRLLAERSERSVHLESDTFFRWIVGGYVAPWSPDSHEQNEAVMAIVGDAATAYASAGYLTIVDGMLIPGWFLEPVTARLRSANLDVATVILLPPLEVCLERAGSRSARPLSDPAVVRKLWDEFATVGAPKHVIIDSAEMTAEETVFRVVRATSFLDDSQSDD